MAELRSTTAIGGNIVWHGGNLRFDPQGETVLYNGHKIFTEHDTPLPSELGNGGTTSAYTKTESNATFAPIHTAGYVRKDGDAMTGKLTTSGNDIEIQGSSPRLTLLDWTDSKKWFVVSDGGNLTVREDTTSTTRVSIETNVVNLNVDNFNLRGKTAFRSYDSWLRINDTGEFTDGIYFGSSRVRTDGELYVGTTTTNGLYVTPTIFQFQGNRVFHNAYHPNADKWTTARTLTLSGDVSGSVSWDGSANASLSVTVANDSHSHDGRYYTETESDARYVNVAGDTMTGDLVVEDSMIKVGNVSGDNYMRLEQIYTDDYGFTFTHGNASAIRNDQGGLNQAIVLGDSETTGTIFGVSYNKDGSWTRSSNLTAAGELYIGLGATARAFHDAYHPNADKWTNARTLTLSGDASGSVVWDGSTNATISVTVANDSHSHDGRYYTETESDSRFAPINGAGYVAKSGDTMTGSIQWGSSSYKGLYFGHLNEAASGFNGAWSFVRQGPASGTLEIGSDNEVNFYETDSFVKRIFMTLNDGTVNAVKFVGALQGNASTATSAAKWTTARTLTTTLTGDVTGSASMSVDGSGNKTVSITTTVANDSHMHTRLDPLNANWNTQTDEFRTGSASNVAGAPTTAFINWIQWGHNGGSKFRHTLYSETGAIDQLHYAYRNNTSTTAADHAQQRIFMDNYHPNADKWTTARTLTTTLTGDVSGSASMSVDGSGNKTVSITTTVANDSHSHDGRYYTETESDARFAQYSEFATLQTYADIAGKYLGKVSTSGVLEVARYIDFHTTNSTADYDIRLDCSASNLLSVTGGDFTCSGNVTAYSDIRLKKNIEKIDDALDKVTQLNGYTFDRADVDCDRQTGVIAQEVQAVLPEAVVEGEDHLSVAYGNLSGLLIESIKELNEKVETLQSEVHELKKPWWKKILGL
ncbi:long tail fiber protein distal subunit [Vibrio phage 6E35-1b]